MPSKAKTKGSSGERELASILGEIFGEKFIRVPNSGAYVGGGNVARRAAMDKGQVGLFKADLIPPTSMPKLVVECKSYKSFAWHQFLRNDEIKVLEGKDGWITQTITSADEDDVWFLCMKFNNIGWFVLFPQTFVDQLMHPLKIENVISWKNYLIADLKTFFEAHKEDIRNMTAPD